MPWLILLAGAVCEAVWATVLGMSDGPTEPVSAVVFVAALVASLIGLGLAVEHIPIGSAYAVWTGVGAALTVGYAMLTGTESVTLGKLVCVVGIIVAVAGLELISDERSDR